MSDTGPTQNAREVAKQALRAAFLSVASDLLEHEGPQALSMRRIAKRAGCTTGSLYGQFEAKEEIIAALYDEGFARLQVALARADAREPLERVKELNRSYRSFAIANPMHYGIMFARPVAEFRPSEEQLKTAWQSIMPLVKSLEACTEQGLLRGDAEAMALELWLFAHGLVSAELSGHVSLDNDRSARIHEAAMRDLLGAWGG